MSKRIVISTLALAHTLACGPHDPAMPMPDMTPKQETALTVQPDGAFLGRQVTLTLTGKDAGFAEGKTRVDLGDPNLKVEAVRVKSADLLEADVAVGPADPADPGTLPGLAPHDVTARTDGVVATAKGAFQVRSPLEVQVIGPGLTQGGIGEIEIKNLDEAHPFSEETMALLPAEGGIGEVFSAPEKGPVRARVRIDAKAGQALGLWIQDSEKGTSYLLPAGLAGAPKIAARQPAELAIGGQQSGSLPGPGATAVWHLAVPGPRLVSLRMGWDPNAAFRPLLGLLPGSGRWTEILSPAVADEGPPQLFALLSGPGDLYGVVETVQNDEEGGSGSGYQIGAKAQAVHVQAAQASSNPSAPSQIDLSQSCTQLTGLSFPDLEARHYFAFTVPQSGRVWLLTGVAQQPKADLQILEGTCAAGTEIGTPGPAASAELTAGKPYCAVAVPSVDEDGAIPYSVVIARDL